MKHFFISLKILIGIFAFNFFQQYVTDKQTSLYGTQNIVLKNILKFPILGKEHPCNNNKQNPEIL